VTTVCLLIIFCHILCMMCFNAACLLFGEWEVTTSFTSIDSTMLSLWSVTVSSIDDVAFRWNQTGDAQGRLVWVVLSMIQSFGLC